MARNENPMSPPHTHLLSHGEVNGSTPLNSRTSATLPNKRTETMFGASSCSSCTILQNSIRDCQLQNETLTRSLSHILATLKSAKDLVGNMERLLEKKSPSPRRTPEPQPFSPLISPSQLLPEDGLLHANMVESMYPAVDACNVPQLGKLVSGLHSLLVDAANMCLSSAGSSFSTSVALSRAARTPSTSSSSRKNKLTRMQTLPSFHPPPILSMRHTTNTSTSTAAVVEPGELMADHMASNFSHIHKLSGGDSLGSLKRSHSETHLDSSEVDLEMSMLEMGADQTRYRGEQFHSHLLSLLDKQQPMSELTVSESLVSLSGSEPPARETREYVCPLGNGLSGDESKQLLEKIAFMENQRLKLMTEVEELRDQNGTLWESLSEIASDVDCKTLHLQIVLRDLHEATNEIKKSTEIRQRVDELLSERDSLIAKLTNMEDESLAVKESLVQLLQEKSATNRTLTLENQRLRTKMVQLRSNSGPASMNQQTSDTDITDVFDDDGISMDDDAQYVHRSGFLVKQGGRIKNWKKRLFVLTSSSLSYFKTEEAIGTIALESITKVQLQHGLTAKQHMFEVHTQGGRVYNLSARTHEDMQHWMGMIQTLIHSRNQTLRRSIHRQERHSARLAPKEEAGSPRLSTHSPISTSPPATGDGSYPPPGYKAVKHRSRTSLTSLSSTIHIPRVEVSTDAPRVRMFSAAKTAPLMIQMDTTDEEDEGDRDGRSPLISSDEETKTGSKHIHQKQKHVMK